MNLATLAQITGYITWALIAGIVILTVRLRWLSKNDRIPKPPQP